MRPQELRERTQSKDASQFKCGDFDFESGDSFWRNSGEIKSARHAASNDQDLSRH